MLKRLLPPAYLHRELLKRRTHYFISGGADPCLVNFSNYLSDHQQEAPGPGMTRHVATVNAQTAVAAAAGVTLSHRRVCASLGLPPGPAASVPCVIAGGAEVGGLAQALLAFQAEAALSLPVLLLIGWGGGAPERLGPEPAGGGDAGGEPPAAPLEDLWRVGRASALAAKDRRAGRPVQGPRVLPPYRTGPGEALEAVLGAIDVPYSVVPGVSLDAPGAAGAQDCFYLLDVILDKAYYHLQSGRGTPFAILFPENVFQPYRSRTTAANAYGGLSVGGGGGGPRPLEREAVLEQIVRQARPGDVFLCNVGLTGEAMRDVAAALHSRHATFLPVSGAGLLSAVAAGVALADESGGADGVAERNIVVIDGDGACLAELGALANAGMWAADARLDPRDRNRTLPGVLRGLKHIVLNNGSADSSSLRYYYQQGRAGGGGAPEGEGEEVHVLDFQNPAPTAALDVSLSHVAKACGYRVANHEMRAGAAAAAPGAVNLRAALYAPGEDPVMDMAELLQGLAELYGSDGPGFLEVLVASAAAQGDAARGAGGKGRHPPAAARGGGEDEESESATAAAADDAGASRMQFAGFPSVGKYDDPQSHARLFAQQLGGEQSPTPNNNNNSGRPPTS